MTDTSSQKHPAGQPGDQETLQEEVVEKYVTMRPALLSYVHQLLRNVSESEDVVQATFMRLFDAQYKKGRIENLRAWLYRVAHNLAIDHLRKRSKHDVLSKEWPIHVRQLGGEADVEKKLIERETIAGVLSRLNEREKYCLLLRAEGLSYEEIASVVEISAKAVSVYLVRALKKAREQA